MKFGMGNLNSGNLSSDELYRLVALLQVVLVAGLSFFLNEKPVVKKDRSKLTLKRYATDLLGHPIRRKFAAPSFYSLQQVPYYLNRMIQRLRLLNTSPPLFTTIASYATGRTESVPLV